MAEQNFRIDTSNYLGIEHSNFKNKLMEIALVNPSDYFQLREYVLKSVKEQAIKTFYDTLYYVLSEGKLTATAAPGSAATDGTTAARRAAQFVPKYPKQKITEIALQGAKTMDSIIDDVIEIILPIDYQQLAQSRLTRKGEARGIDA